MSTFRVIRKLALFIAKKALCYTFKFFAFLMSLAFEPKRAAIPVIDDHNLVTPATKLSKQIRDGHLSSEEVVESFISRIKILNPILNAVVEKRFEQALKEAREIDRKLTEARDGDGDKSILSWPLVGVPISIKETIALEGYSYTGGLLARRLVKANKNSDAVKMVLKNGMIPICVTNVPELSMWWDTSNPVYGHTNNPYDLSRIPGGSSGGEASLISSGGSVVGVGNDIAGSIRIPTNFCGIFGHKPTPYVVSNEGMYPTNRGDREKLLGTGPITRYACDMAPLLKVLAGDKADKLRLDEPVDLTKLKIYYVEELGDPMCLNCNPDILKGIRDAVSYLATKFKVPAEKVFFEELRHGMFLWSAEAKTDPTAMPVSKQFKDGSSGELNPVIELAKKFVCASDHNLNSIMITSMESISPNRDSKEGQFLNQQAADLRRKFNELLGDDGILLVPTHPEPAPLHNTTFLKVFNVAYTATTSTLQAPITQVPLGLSKEGLPFGVQVLARPFNDRLTLAVACELEKLSGWVPPCRIDV